MLRKLILTAIALIVSVASASAQSQPYRGYSPTQPRDYPPRNWREDHRHWQQGRHIGYYIQFRQPYWRQQMFSDEGSMSQFVQGQRANGWEVQVLPQGNYQFLVRYRLMNWGGSRVLPTQQEAEQWALKLENESGYETRIVPMPVG